MAVGQGKFATIDSKYWAEVQSLGSWNLNNKGYIRVTFKGKEYWLHKLIYSFVDSNYAGKVDHKDNNPLNNLEENLRPATSSQNMANSNLSIRNTSGVKGVSWDKKCQKWRAYIRINGQQISLGYFDSIEEAAEVRRAAAIRYFGEFAREL